MQKCTQKGRSVHVYNTAFNRLALALGPTLPADIIIQTYLVGLDTKLQVLVIADPHHRSSLNYLQTLALRQGKALGIHGGGDKDNDDEPTATASANEVQSSDSVRGKGRGNNRTKGSTKDRPADVPNSPRPAPKCAICCDESRHRYEDCPHVREAKKRSTATRKPVVQQIAAPAAEPAAHITDADQQVAAAMVLQMDSDDADDTGDSGNGTSAYTTVDARGWMQTTFAAKGRRGPPMDSCATHHMVPDAEWFHTRTPSRRSIKTAAKNARVSAEGVGTVLLKNHADHKNIRMDNVLHAPKLAMPLFSVMAATNAGFDVIFAAHGRAYICKDPPINYSDLNPIATGSRGPQFYHFDGSPVTGKDHDWEEDAEAMPMAALSGSANYNRWHERLGHLGVENMRLLQKMATGSVSEANFSPDHVAQICDPCVMGRITRIPHHDSTTTHARGTHISVDYSGPHALGLNDEAYVASFIKWLTRHIRSYFMRTKKESEAIAALQDYLAWLQARTGTKVLIHQSDGGGEFIGKNYRAVLSTNGIEERTTVRDTPAQNGLAERLNRTMADRVRAIRLSAKIPARLWPEIWRAVLYLKNRSPHRYHGKIPHQLIHNNEDEPINLDHLRVIGSVAYSHLTKKERNWKFSPVAQRLVHVGYPTGVKGYRLWDPVTDAVIDRCDVLIDEDTNWSTIWPTQAAGFDEIFANPDDTTIFTVDRILNHRKIDEDYKFRVKWKHYPVKDATWEPV